MLAPVRRSHTALGILALLGLLAAGIQGFEVEPRQRGELLHLTLAVLASLLALLAHSWFTVYLLALGHGLKGEASPAPGLRIQGRSRRALPWAISALVLILAVILCGAFHISWLPVWGHGALAALALLIHGVAVVLERKSLVDLDRDLRHWDSREIPGHPTLNAAT